MDNGWKSFPINGARYLSDDIFEARDLDLFGKSSLYQYICTASTIWGQDQLALWLGLAGKDSAKDSAAHIFDGIKGRQQAASELAQKFKFSMEFEACARCLRKIEYDKSKEIIMLFSMPWNKGPFSLWFAGYLSGCAHLLR